MITNWIFVTVCLIVVLEAIIVINDCIERQLPIATLNAMKNPVAQLVNVVEYLWDKYLSALLEAKTAKTQAARHKVLFSC